MACNLSRSDGDSYRSRSRRRCRRPLGVIPVAAVVVVVEVVALVVLVYCGHRVS